MLELFPGMTETDVAPHAGAWIEIRLGRGNRGPGDRGRPPRGGVD